MLFEICNLLFEHELSQTLNRSRSGGSIQFKIRAFKVRLDGIYGNEHTIGDLVIGFAVVNILKDFKFSFCKGRQKMLVQFIDVQFRRLVIDFVRKIGNSYFE